MVSYWFCIKSPQYGLLPFTAHTMRRGAIERFELHGLSLTEMFNSKGRVAAAWKRSKKEGFRCMKVRVST